MTYTRNYVYSKVADAVTGAFPNARCTGRFTPTPATLPNVYIYELDKRHTMQGADLNATDVQWESTFEVQITATNANLAYSIMDTVEASFRSMYYRLFNQAFDDTGTKFYLVGQFRRVIGGGDVAPT